MKHFVYFFLLFFTLSYPLYKSFEGKIQFHKKWKFLFPGIILSATFFIIWDIYFTNLGVWSFSSEYTIGFQIGNLPIEEWLFFIIVPFSCMFIYEVMNYFVPKDVLGNSTKFITLFLIISCILLAIIYNENAYTFSVASILGALLIIHQFILRSTYLGKFYIAWAVCFLPFFLVNGVLTALPVVSYNSTEMIGLRIYTIPFEDFFYGMINVLQVLTVYEYLKTKKINSTKS